MKRAAATVELLSAREFALLHALLLRPGAILTRNELENVSTAGTRKWKATSSTS
jgi:DNA-binding response OmpR family regulator